MPTQSEKRVSYDYLETPRRPSDSLVYPGPQGGYPILPFSHHNDDSYLRPPSISVGPLGTPPSFGGPHVSEKADFSELESMQKQEHYLQRLGGCCGGLLKWILFALCLLLFLMLAVLVWSLAEQGPERTLA